jgi:16S rRNA (guanine527-N7)-methyltransferase
LARATEDLGLADRVAVVGERAEVAGRGPRRATMDLVVARSFGSPGPTAECGSPFLRRGGTLAVAEPPGGQPDRWPDAGVALLGLQVGLKVDGPTAYQLLTQVSLCPDRFPRRVGIPTKRPLF